MNEDKNRITLRVFLCGCSISWRVHWIYDTKELAQKHGAE
ncbi:MAG: hypothetical protein CM15mP130_2760 [Verrucomicrobiota bacterium]|nr:MAG: hypothetical protein CM15mP130_2760 [Verrucomicrobiota bacterium]